MPLAPGAGRAPASPPRPARSVWPFVLGFGVLAALVVGLGGLLLYSLLTSRQPIESGVSVPQATIAAAAPSATPAVSFSGTAVMLPPSVATLAPVTPRTPSEVARTPLARRTPNDLGPASGVETSAPVPPPTRAVRVGGQIKEPKKLTNVNPVYPDIAKQARVQGIVILECTIGPQGKVADVKVLRGIPLLDEAAIDAVKQWVYTPTLMNGVPVPVIMTVTVNFKLS